MRPKATTITSGVDCPAYGNPKSDKIGSNADTIEIGEDWRDFFMPFGSGPRTCLGQAMVQTEVAYVLVRLLQEFPSIVIDEEDVDRPFKEAKAVSFYNEGGVSIRVM